MSFLFDGLELDHNNFILKFGGTHVLAQVEEGGKPIPIMIDNAVAGRYSYFYKNGNTLSRAQSNYFNLVRQLPKSLGYVNVKNGGVAFARLKGARQQKQGLCHDRCTWSATYEYPSPIDLFSYYYPESSYPSIEEAVWKLMKGTDKLIALSCNFALESVGSIIFNNNIIIGNYSNDIVIYDDELLELWNNEVHHG